MKTMKAFYRSFYLILIFLIILLFIPHKSSAPAASNPEDLGNFVFNPLIRHGKHAPLCSGEVHGYARCHARVVVDSEGSPFVTAAPSGYGPAQFLGAYNLPSSASSNPGPIIAIVDAYDQPYILSDLNKYCSTFGIPTLPACVGSITGSSVPCFQKVDQNGGQSYPNIVDSGWALEISLDVEVAHAICQNCKILLVEAYSTSYANLMAAVDRAVLMGATVISNSYGSSEFSSETAYDSHFNHPGIAFTFSSGDSGYGTSYPAASQYVTAVGGTTLDINSNNSYQSESAWNGSGSGCSYYEPQPSWQQLVNPNTILCSKRIIADVSADADPNTGAAVYDSVPYQLQSGWFTVGGTSLSSPIIAGIYALAGGVSSTIQGNSIPYNNYSTYLHDITSGSNGRCGGTYLCTANPGYDGPTGLGTPNGAGAFTLTPTSTPPPTPTPTPPPSDTIPPQVKITKPLNMARVFGNVTITASASDNVGVKEVDFYIDGKLLARDTLSPYTSTWNSSTASRGTHTIKAVAVDTSGNTASNQITVFK